MSKKARRKQCQAVRLLDQAMKQYRVIVQSSSSYQSNTDTSVATFERYLRRLKKLVDVPGAAAQFWSLHQKVYIRLLKETVKLRD